MATSWSEGRLIFQGVSLSAAIAEVNRYSRDKIVLEAPGLAGQPTSGVFETGDTETFAKMEQYPKMEGRQMMMVLAPR